jgi:aminoglycoside phosphotransferase (APT) family kinase protein
VSAGDDARDLGAPLAAHSIDPTALATYLRDHIPGFGDSCTIQQFRGGQSNPTYLIESGGHKFVLRKKPPGQLLPSAHAVDREFRVIAALADTTVPVPQALHLCEDETVIGQIFYVMRYVSGRVFAGIAMSGCMPAQRTAAYLAATRVLRDLHAVDYQRAGLSAFGKPDNYIARQVGRWSQQYEMSKTEECVAMDELTAWLLANDPGDQRSSIVHGDYRPGNLIFSHEDMSVAAVLDWELSTIGHPMADLGYFLLPFHLDSRVSGFSLRGLDLDALGIPSEQRLLETYQSGGAPVGNIDYYIAFSLFRLAAILAGVLRRGLDGNAADPTAVERGRAYALFAASGVEISARASA